MELDIEKCAMLIRKRAKRQITEGLELLNPERSRTLEEKENSKYLGILEADTIKQAEVKKKKKKKKEKRKEYTRRIKKLIEFKFCCRTLIKGTNTWAVSF